VGLRVSPLLVICGCLDRTDIFSFVRPVHSVRVRVSEAASTPTHNRAKYLGSSRLRLPQHPTDDRMLCAWRQRFSFGRLDQWWQNGVLLRPRRQDSEALVRADYHTRTIDILVKGTDATLYLGMLRDSILAALETMPQLPFEELRRQNSAARGRSPMRCRASPTRQGRSLPAGASRAAGRRRRGALCRHPRQQPSQLRVIPRTGPPRGRDAALVERFGDAVQARYAGRP
jgi:hypothetical protein